MAAAHRLARGAGEQPLDETVDLRRDVHDRGLRRDDLADGGADQFAALVTTLRRTAPNCRIELLIPDLQGSQAALATILASGPDLLGHNLETVPRLYPAARPQADYGRSLAVLRRLKGAAPAKAVKSGFMLGLGETAAEVSALLADLRAAGVDALAVGQYLRPTPRELPVERFVPEEGFASLAQEARALGFRHVACGPLVRSSYRAGETAVLF